MGFNFILVVIHLCPRQAQVHQIEDVVASVILMEITNWSPKVFKTGRVEVVINVW